MSFVFFYLITVIVTSLFLNIYCYIKHEHFKSYNFSEITIAIICLSVFWPFFFIAFALRNFGFWRDKYGKN